MIDTLKVQDIRAEQPPTNEASYSQQDLEMVAQFDVQDLLPIGMTIVVFGIGIAYGLNVMEDVQDDMTENSAAYNATGDGITAVAKFPSKLGLIVTVIIAAVVIGILVRYLFVRYG